MPAPARKRADDAAPEGPAEQSRARHPNTKGFVERDGVRVFYEVYGQGEPTILFIPPWSIVHSRVWKMQIPYFSRHGRVIVFDPRGNGRTDRPLDVAQYGEDAFVADIRDILDATGTERAFVVTMSRGAQRTLLFCTEHPERVAGAVFICPGLPLTEAGAGAYAMVSEGFDKELPDDHPTRWFSERMWQRDYPGFVREFMNTMFTDPHSTKQIEDGNLWGNETDSATLARTWRGPSLFLDRPTSRALVERLTCPVLVVHGTDDLLTPFADGNELARMTGGNLEVVPGSGHGPMSRKPVQVNLAIREFVEPGWKRGARPVRRGGPKRALFISSPIGLGHARRDVAVAQALRELVPDIQIDWLAQDPVTRVLEADGERLHPASAHLASESGHIEAESGEHDLHCFQAWRRMDEILLNNFMVFHDVIHDQPYDLWVGDEAWELDYYLHENPNEKRAPYAWMTDFVGWLPMADGGEREAYVAADYNAEMIGHIARLPHVRDRALFVGNPEDIVPDRFGPELPLIREWTEANFEFPGYITGFDPIPESERAALRDELGYRPDEQVCIVTVGGSGVGGHLLRRIIAAYPAARRAVPALRMIVVAGPRIDPGSLPRHPGLEIVPYVHGLYRHLAVCDLALVQGGLTTSMELTANRRPFLYFPLRHHFEQNFHVHHRLQRHGAGRRMEFDEATPEVIAAAIAEDIGRTAEYRHVETDGARKAAARLADML